MLGATLTVVVPVEVVVVVVVSLRSGLAERCGLWHGKADETFAVVEFLCGDDDKGGGIIPTADEAADETRELLPHDASQRDDGDKEEEDDDGGGDTHGDDGLPRRDGDRARICCRCSCLDKLEQCDLALSLIMLLEASLTDIPWVERNFRSESDDGGDITVVVVGEVDFTIVCFMISSCVCDCDFLAVFDSAFSWIVNPFVCFICDHMQTNNTRLLCRQMLRWPIFFSQKLVSQPLERIYHLTYFSIIEAILFDNLVVVGVPSFAK